MKFCKSIISLLSAVIVGTSLGLSSNQASADTVENAATPITEKINQSKWVYPFKACQKNGVHPMSNVQTFGMTDYLCSTNPPSYFHDDWDFGHSEVGYFTVYAIHAGTVKKVAYGSGLDGLFG